MKKGCFRNILIGIGILILLGFVVSILGRDDKQEDTQMNITQVAGTVLAAMTQDAEAIQPEEMSTLVAPTVQPIEIAIAPPYSVIKDSVNNMTEIQWKEYLPSLEGMRIENWTGWVVDVDKSSGDEYKIWVDMDDPSEVFSTQDVYLYGISQEEAAVISKDSKITFSGIIEDTTEFLGSVSINVEDVVYQISN